MRAQLRTLSLTLAITLPSCGPTELSSPGVNSGGAGLAVGGHHSGAGGHRPGGAGGAATAAGGRGGVSSGGSAAKSGATGGVSSPVGGRGGASGGGSAKGGSTASGGTTTGTGGGNSAGAGGGTDPGPGCTAPTSYRNLFGELLSKTDAEVDAKLAAAYEQLFHGDSNQTVYYETGSDQAYILDVNSNDVRSEGISYGMMISVQLDKQDEYERLWRWAKRYMEQSNGLFAWQVSPSGNVISQFSAPDGEEYISTALLFASKRWGDGADPFDYANQAQALLDAQIERGNFNRNNKLVTFGNSGTSAMHTDPSYMLPAFYEVWACKDSTNEQFWRDAITAARAFFPKTCHQTTGLAPYLANFDGSNYNNSTFNSDAWRVVGNIMMDHNLFAADPWQLTFAEKYAAFFESTNPFADEFQLDGTIRHQNPMNASKGLVAQNAMVAFGLPAAEGTPFVQALWDMQIPEGQYRYYDGMLYMLALLHVSGRFHLWI